MTLLSFGEFEEVEDEVDESVSLPHVLTSTCTFELILALNYDGPRFLH